MTHSHRSVVITLDVGTATLLLASMLQQAAGASPQPALYSIEWHSAKAIEAVKNALLAWPEAAEK